MIGLLFELKPEEVRLLIQSLEETIRYQTASESVPNKNLLAKLRNGLIIFEGRDRELN